MVSTMQLFLEIRHMECTTNGAIFFPILGLPLQMSIIILSHTGNYPLQGHFKGGGEVG